MNAPLVLAAGKFPWTALEMLDHLWQSTVVAALILLVLLLAPGLTARTRCLLGWIAVAKFFLPAALFTGLAPVDALVSAETSDTAFILPVAMPVLTKPLPEAGAVAGWSVAALVGRVWILGSGVLLGLWLVRAIRMRRRILAASGPVSDAMAALVEKAARRAGVDAPPRCVCIGAEFGPGLLGLFSPVVVLPRGLEAALTRAELESVLIHELVHLRRFDNLWSAVRVVFVSLFWFHPVAWLLSRRITIETEQACDERVLEITRDADAYASGIVKSVRHALGLVAPGFSGATTPPVMHRLQRILAHDARRRPVFRGIALTVGLALVIGSGRAGSFAKPELSDVREIAAAVVAPEPAAARAAAIPGQGGNSIAAPQDRSAQSPAMPEIAPDFVAVRQVLQLEPSPDATHVAADPRANPAGAESVQRQQAFRVVASAEPSSVSRTDIHTPERSDLVVTASLAAAELGDQAPVPILQPAPRVPTWLRRRGTGGEVLVELGVNAEGAVANVRVVSSSHRELEAIVAKTVRNWTFKPARKAGRDVSANVRLPVIFSTSEE